MNGTRFAWIGALLVACGSCPPTGEVRITFEQLPGPDAPCAIEPLRVGVQRGTLDLEPISDWPRPGRVDGGACAFRQAGTYFELADGSGVRRVEIFGVIDWEAGRVTEAEVFARQYEFGTGEGCEGDFRISISGP